MLNEFNYLIPTDPDRWVERIDAACCVLEEKLGIALLKAHTGTKNNMTKINITNRTDYLKKKLKTRTRWFSIFDGNGGIRRTPSGFKNEDYFCVGGCIHHTGNTYKVSITLPEQSPEVQGELLQSLHRALELPPECTGELIIR